MASINEIADDILREAANDSVALWAIADAVRWDLSLSNNSDVKTATLDVVSELLQHGLWPGNFRHGGSKIYFWDEPDTAACLARIDMEWDVTEGDPVMSKPICWFRSRQP